MISWFQHHSVSGTQESQEEGADVHVKENRLFKVVNKKYFWFQESKKWSIKKCCMSDLKHLNQEKFDIHPFPKAFIPQTVTRSLEFFPWGLGVDCRWGANTSQDTITNNMNWQSSYKACHWTGGGNWWKALKHEENVRTRSTQNRGKNRPEANVLVTKPQCLTPRTITFIRL